MTSNKWGPSPPILSTMLKNSHEFSSLYEAIGTALVRVEELDSVEVCLFAAWDVKDNLVIVKDCDKMVARMWTNRDVVCPYFKVKSLWWVK